MSRNARFTRVARRSSLLVAAAAVVATTIPSAARADDNSVVVVPEPVSNTQNSPQAKAESAVTKTSVDPETRLAEIKARGASAIAQRQATIVELSAKLASQTKDCGTNAAMSAELARTAAELTSIGTNLAAATDVNVAKTLSRSVYIDERVYLLVAPKNSKVVRCDTQLVRNDALNAEGVKLQSSIDAAKAKGTDTTAAQAAKDAAMAQLAAINPAPALAPITGLAPDHGDKTVQASNTAALNGADAALDATFAAQKSVNKQFAAVRDLLKGANGEARTERKAERKAEVEAKKAEHEAKKAEHKAEVDAKKAARSAARSSRKS